VVSRPLIVDVVVPVTPKGAITDPAELPALLRTPSVLNPLSATELLARMDGFGIGQAIVPARCYGSLWGLSYTAVRDFVAQAPDRLFAIAGIDPLARPSRLRDFDEAVRDWGFVGAHTYSSWSGVPADDRSYYPYYAKAEELGVPFQVECVAAKGQLPTMGHPRHIERIAADFPGLKIVAIHTGYPWERELAAVAAYTPNVYLGCDGVAPATWPPDLLAFVTGTGYGARPGAPGTTTRTVFGTNYLSMDVPSALAFIDRLNLDPVILARLLRDNARNLYGLPDLGDV
jgi:predicted TIM-barrel fold metal-dependent hydrolase